MYGNTKDPEEPKQSWERRTELEESGCLISDYTTKLQSSKQYGSGTKTEIEINGTEADRENRPVVAKEWGRRELDWEFGISRYKLVYIEWINSKVLLYSTGKYIQYHVINHNGSSKKSYEIYMVHICIVYIYIYMIYISNWINLLDT